MLLPWIVMFLILVAWIGVLIYRSAHKAHEYREHHPKPPHHRTDA